MPTDDDRRRDGEATRRAVLGDAHVDRSLKGVSDFDREWVDFITRTAWGDVWCRPGLDRKTRSVIVLAITAATGRTEEFRIHVKGAIANGLTPDEIREVLMQAAIYGGVPAANHAFREAKQVLADMGIAV